MIAPLLSQPDARFGGGPPIIPIDKSKEPTTPEMDLSQFKNRFNAMRLEYMSKWYAPHREVSRFIDPKRGFFEGYQPNQNAPIDHRLIITGKPRRCLRTLAAGMQSGLSSPSMPWFEWGLPDPDLEQYQPAKSWLEKNRNTMLRLYAGSNIYQGFHQNYEELGQFGTGTYGIYEDYDTVMRSRSYTCGEYYLANDPTGRINAFARWYWKTVDQMVNEYGMGNCSAKIQNAYRANRRDEFIMVQELVEENTTMIEGKIGFEGKRFRQVTWEAEGKLDRPLAISGYNEFPIIGVRWQTVTTADIYGVGPGMYALGDVKSTYRLKKDILLGANKKVDPPVQAGPGVQGHPNMNPGGITRNSQNTPDAGVRAAYEVNIDLGEAMELLQSFYHELDEECYTSLFAAMASMNEATQKTAAEIAARHQETLLLIGPVLERVFSEMFRPTIDRTFALAMRAGLISPPPPELAGMELEPRFISLLARAQQIVKNAANERALGYMGNMIAVHPDAADVVNFDELVRDEFEGLGVTAKALNSPEQIAQIREAKAKKQQEIEMKQDMMAATVAAKNLAGAQVGPKNALEHLTGAEGSGGAA